MLQGKNVLLGVTGGIAAYKIPTLCSLLVKHGVNVETILTDNAQKIVSPIPFESLSGNRCHTDTFDPRDTSKIEHIALARNADLLVIAPASANMIAKLRWGLADDMLSTTALACTCKKLLVPAMNTNMYENPATQENLAILTGSAASLLWSHSLVVWPVVLLVLARCQSLRISLIVLKQKSPVKKIYQICEF